MGIKEIKSNFEELLHNQCIPDCQIITEPHLPKNTYHMILNLEREENIAFLTNLLCKLSDGDFELLKPIEKRYLQYLRNIIERR